MALHTLRCRSRHDLEDSRRQTHLSANSLVQARSRCRSTWTELSCPTSPACYSSQPHLLLCTNAPARPASWSISGEEIGIAVIAMTKHAAAATSILECQLRRTDALHGSPTRFGLLASGRIEQSETNQGHPFKWVRRLVAVATVVIRLSVRRSMLHA
jgi:hypothetical protein